MVNAVDEMSEHVRSCTECEETYFCRGGYSGQDLWKGWHF